MRWRRHKYQHIGIDGPAGRKRDCGLKHSHPKFSAAPAGSGCIFRHRHKPHWSTPIILNATRCNTHLNEIIATFTTIKQTPPVCEYLSGSVVPQWLLDVVMISTVEGSGSHWSNNGSCYHCNSHTMDTGFLDDLELLSYSKWIRTPRRSSEENMKLRSGVLAWLTCRITIVAVMQATRWDYEEVATLSTTQWNYKITRDTCCRVLGTPLFASEYFSPLRASFAEFGPMIAINIDRRAAGDHSAPRNL